MTKISEQFIENILNRFSINFSKDSIKNLTKQFHSQLTDGLDYEKIEESYLEKYKTNDLATLFMNMLNNKMNKKGCEIVLDIINILLQRYRKYQLISSNNNKKVTPHQVDNILFPSTRITTVEGTHRFTIVRWRQLHIEIRDISPNKAVFRKIINNKPSNHKVIERYFDELHLGLTTREILKVFGYLKLNESYKHPLNKKDQVFRINKALKQLFKIPSDNNPFFWKKNQLYAKVSVTAYDSNNVPVLPFPQIKKT
tara:strand:+ start:536 stop:1300 length:765 start_codon:yes stop_codon:yes gene_type:complete